MLNERDLTLKVPNNEQREAIEHSGGVLLSAGAGSGKTFVLVEHIVYLFEEFCKKKGSATEEDFSTSLREYFSQIVMMTFTKKAAGELSLRLLDRFEIAKQRSEQLEGELISTKFWSIANDLLDNIFVGTIHSFCFRLISQGLIPGFSGNEDMISDPELRNKLNGLFDNWIEDNINFLKEEEMEHVLVNKVFFRNHFLKVFSDTDLRVIWSNFKPESRLDVKADFEALLPLFCKREWIEFKFSAESFRPDDKKMPAWFTFLEGFSESIKECKDFGDFLEKANTFFDSIKRMASAPRKDGYDAVKEHMARIKDLKEFCKSYFSDYEASVFNEEIYKKNGELYLKIYQALEKDYLKTPGLTFTDLEFFVWRALSRNLDASKEVQNNYSYFIIDEFQDTSSVQFSIVKCIVEDNLKKVFCVGDVKQAIYGFRGGELGVFNETESSIHRSLSLRNNYRSSEKVINLNNELFDFILPLGENFTGTDEYSVSMLKQVVPEFREGTGHLTKRTVNVEGELSDGSKSLKPTALNLIESTEIAKKILEEPDKTFCILYRKLTPTRFLIPALTKLEVGFTCQVKVQLDQDPILALFCEFTRMLCFSSSAEEFKLSHYIIGNILSFLNLNKSQKEIEKNLENSLIKCTSLGLLESFKQLLWEMGLSSTNLQHPWPLVEVLCELSLNDPELAYEKVSEYSDGNYSIDFKFGTDSGRVTIMTAHSSKGLEFDHVILGGIHTNGVDKNDGDLLGKFPFSYRWFIGQRKSEVFRSPSYIREQEIKKRKSFSESKRLFYVAATRAVKSLSWVDISFNSKPASFSKNSWINALRLWEANSTQEVISLSEAIKEGNTVFDRDLGFYDLENQRLDLITPVYQTNALGVDWSIENIPSLGFSSELSVTRLAALEQCPRKFHLKNVLKLTGEETINENLIEKSPVEDESEVVLDETFSSSASRGTRVHEVLEEMLKRNFVLPRILDLDDDATQGVSWIADLLKDKYFSDNFNFISEVQVKFPIFGQMVSGTPDLIIEPKASENSYEIWDYKTGHYSEQKCSPYWFQLYCYALSLNVGDESKVKLILAFIDEQKLIAKEMTLREVKDLLFISWKKLAEPDEINQEHCKVCDFRGLCLPSS